MSKEKLKLESEERFRKMSKVYVEGGFKEATFHKLFSVVKPSQWRGRIVLDVGCGEGRYASKFAKEGSITIGLDSSPSMIRIAKNYSISCPNIHFIYASATNLPIKEGVVDLCIVIELLHHFTDEFVEKCISEINRVTHEDSVLIFDLKNSLNPFLNYRYKKYDCVNYTLKCRSIKKIKRIIDKNGFKMIKKFIVPFPNKFAYLTGPLAPLFILYLKRVRA